MKRARVKRVRRRQRNRGRMHGEEYVSRQAACAQIHMVLCEADDKWQYKSETTLRESHW